MALTLRLVSGWQKDVAAVLAGALIPLSLAPYYIWPLGIIAPMLLALLLQNASVRRGVFRSFMFGLGMFGKGASWVYVAIHDFGYTSASLAFILTSLFVLGLALVFALPFIVYSRFCHASDCGHILGFAAIWTLGEWSRSWFLTGFPWLYLGYAHVDTWLAGWAPVLGIFGLSFFCTVSAMLILYLFFEARHLARSRSAPPIKLISYCLSLTAIWVSGFFLSHLSWSSGQHTEKISVAIVQPNIPQEIKWSPLYRKETLNILRQETSRHWDKDLILWPEAAVPLMYHDAQYFLREMDTQATATNTGIITGILYDDDKPNTYFNSIIGLGHAKGIYFKQRLVPFGEYVPLETWLRGLIDFFDLPRSIIFPGPENQEILRLGTHKIAPSICYEIVYPNLVATLAKHASLLVTISNDAWFGTSIGPMQHFQMAQMRALENHRYVLRSTNTGISGIIDPQGKATLRGEQFVRQSMEQFDIELKNGTTLFTQWGSLPVLMLCFLIITGLMFGVFCRRQKMLLDLPS